MKRIISVITLLFVLLSVLPIGSVYAEAPGKFVVGKVEAVQGETVTVKIYTSDNPGIVSLKLMVSYDDSLLELTDITGGAFSNASFGPITSNPIAVNWVDAVHPDNTTNGMVAKLTFKVLDTAPIGRTSITITYDPDDVYDSSFDNVPFDIENGYVKIVEAGCSHANTTTYAAKPSTCTVQGNDKYVKCNDCGEIISGSDAKLPLKSHSCEWRTTKRPTCTEKGTRKYICTVCGAVENTENIAVIDHTTFSEVTKEATCSEYGMQITYCTVCNEVISEEEIPLKSHSLKWNVIKQPTCTEKGRKQYSCTVCGYVVTTENIAATDHIENDGVITNQPTCNGQGTKLFSCTVCGIEMRTQIITPLGHTDGDWVVVSKPTCTSDGERVLRCARCYDEIRHESILQTDHDYNSPWEVVIQATYTDEGMEIQYCSRCGETIEIRAIPVKQQELWFIDVKQSHWFYSSVEFVVKKGYMNGMSETNFSPNSNITREQFVLILANIAGVDTNVYKNESSGFTDVKTGQWYSGAVTWAVKERYVSGMSATKFGRGQSIQRAALARMLYNYASKNGIDTSGRADLSAFGDAKEFDKAGNAWMKEPVQWAVDAEIISGMTVNGKNCVNPKGTATRAQAARMLMQFDELLSK